MFFDVWCFRLLVHANGFTINTSQRLVIVGDIILSAYRVCRCILVTICTESQPRVVKAFRVDVSSDPGIPRVVVFGTIQWVILLVCDVFFARK